MPLGNEEGDWEEKRRGHFSEFVNIFISGYQRLSTLALKLWPSISLLFPGDRGLAMASNVPSDHETTATKSENDEQSGKFLIIY